MEGGNLGENGRRSRRGHHRLLGGLGGDVRNRCGRHVAGVFFLLFSYSMGSLLLVDFFMTAQSVIKVSARRKNATERVPRTQKAIPRLQDLVFIFI